MRRETRTLRTLRITAGLLLGVALAGCGAAERLDAPAVVRGAAEVEVLPDGSLRPLTVAVDPLVGLCLRVPSSLDTSRWEALLTFDGKPAKTGAAAPVARLGETICFEGRPPVQAQGNLQLCGELLDRFDESRRALPCRELRIGGDQETREAHAALSHDFETLLGQLGGGPLSPLLERLDTLAARARKAGLPLLETRFALVTIHFLTREATPASLAEAARRLDHLPAWLDREEASRSGGQAAYARGELEVARGHPAAAWQAFAEAERRYVRVASPERFTVTMQQADLLSQAGAPGEAVKRLRASLDDCERLPCEPGLLPYGHLQLAWLVLLDPEAGPDALAAAQESLNRGLRDIEEDGDPTERATHLINLGYLRLRLHQDPAPSLGSARRLLTGQDAGSGARSSLLGWADLVEGLTALRHGEPARALALCGRTAETGDPALALRALSCAAEAQQEQGGLAAADRGFTEVIARHEQGTGERGIGVRVPLGVGQRADDYAQAARVAIDRGDAGRAWELLARLDRLSVHEGARRQCREKATDRAALDRWEAIDTESETLQRELAALDRPASADRRREIEGLRRTLQERLLALWRDWPGCPEAAETLARGGDAGVRFRAVALDDEVLLLRRNAALRVSVERRTRVPRDRLRQQVAEIGEALRRRSLDDDAWRQLTAPVAALLLPHDVEALEEVTPYALHGLLQGVPLSALPLPSGARWLGAATTITLQPAGVSGHEAPARDSATPLFVIDPLGDLPGGSGLLPLYRDLFPGSRILHRDDARREAFRAALPGAAWLHLDTHGSFDPAFPELSSLQLADGPLSLVQLASFRVSGRFANLSGCETGLWPFTADSGWYGIGGLLARQGVPWVVASRTNLEDALARDFNAAFYRSIRSGRPVPAAYGEAMAAVRRRHPAVSWAGLVLLRGIGGQNGREPTPSSMRPNAEVIHERP